MLQHQPTQRPHELQLHDLAFYVALDLCACIAGKFSEVLTGRDRAALAKLLGVELAPPGSGYKRQKYVGDKIKKAILARIDRLEGTFRYQGRDYPAAVIRQCILILLGVEKGLLKANERRVEVFVMLGLWEPSDDLEESDDEIDAFDEPEGPTKLEKAALKWSREDQFEFVLMVSEAIVAMVSEPIVV